MNTRGTPNSLRQTEYPAYYDPFTSSLDIEAVCQFPISWETPIFEFPEGPTIQHALAAVSPYDYDYDGTQAYQYEFEQPPKSNPCPNNSTLNSHH